MRTIHGVGVSTGNAVAPAILLRPPQPLPTEPPSTDPDADLERITGALAVVAADLTQRSERLEGDAAEMVAANEGLGKMLWDSRLYMLVDDIFVALVSLGLLGFVIDRLFRWAIFAFAGRYSPVA